MRILAGAVCRQNAEVLKAHLNTMLWQDSDHEVDLCYVNDLDIDAPDYKQARDVLYDTEGVIVLGTDVNDRPDGAHYSVQEQTHGWALDTFGWLAYQKQRILDKAREENYDGVWLVDTDLLCGPGTLRSLTDTGRQIVSAVFWTKWQTDSPPLPQVWLQHPYELYMGLKESPQYPQHEFLQDIADRQLIQVYGLGACTYISTDVLDRVMYHPLMDGLPNEGMWQGEDRGFCIRAQRNHIDMWADAWPNVWHCYRPSDREHLEYRTNMLESMSDCDSRRGAAFGDWISFTVEPLEEPRLAQHKEFERGRDGLLRTVPEFELALVNMEVKESRIVEVEFPHWYPAEDYRNQTKRFKIKLLDRQAYYPHPGLESCKQILTDCSEAQPLTIR